MPSFLLVSTGGAVRAEAALLTLAPTLVIELSLCRYPRINRYVAKVGEAGRFGWAAAR